MDAREDVVGTRASIEDQLGSAVALPLTKKSLRRSSTRLISARENAHPKLLIK